MEADWVKIATESGITMAAAVALAWFARWMVRHILATHKADRENWEKERELMRIDHKADRIQWQHDMESLRSSFTRSLDIHERSMETLADKMQDMTFNVAVLNASLGVAPKEPVVKRERVPA